MVRFHFDLTRNDGSVENDETGVLVFDTAAALCECIFCVVEFASEPVAFVTVKNEKGDVLMVLNAAALFMSA